MILKSQFFVYFLSCQNTNKFYDRRKVEFSNSWFTDVKRLFTPTQEEIIRISRQVTEAQNEKPQHQLTEEMKQHIFLEDMTNFSKLNKKYHESLITEFQNLFSNMAETVQILGRLASSFENLFSNHLELEKHSVPAVADIFPPTSRIYSELKTIFYRMQNTTKHSREETKKLFDVCTGNTADRYKQVHEVNQFY